MIFVTVGTHEQPFDRLIECVDESKRQNKITDDVFIQTGYCTYVPKYCRYEKMISFEEMHSYMKQATKIITHGGPSTFMQAISYGKVPIVVPRQHQFNEHVNDHQMIFCKNAIETGYDIELVDHIEELETALLKENRSVKRTSHNAEFNRLFAEHVDELIQK
ncbi:multidrug MFS transporter [Carnobacteriaceae bacterium zg-C25]|nr:multidrug MFS transporter [Carnobacteriaceae bacterium zg-C25]